MSFTVKYSIVSQKAAFRLLIASVLLQIFWFVQNGYNFH